MTLALLRRPGGTGFGRGTAAVVLFLLMIGGCRQSAQVVPAHVEQGAIAPRSDIGETEMEQPGEEPAADGLPTTEEAWRARLEPAQFYVLRQKGTEPSFRNAYWNEKAAGVYHCAGCDERLFDSSTKFDSGTGWPSFWAPLEGKTMSVDDSGFWSVRTEVVCRRCQGHLGHVFDDSPQTPTGRRFCMNSAALRFVPRAEEASSQSKAKE